MTDVHHYRSSDGRVTAIADMNYVHLTNALHKLERTGWSDSDTARALRAEKNRRDTEHTMHSSRLAPLARIFITVNAQMDGRPDAYPLAVIVQSEADVAAGLANGQVKANWRDGAVQVRDMRHAYSYANGINHGLSTAGTPGLPIVVDPRLSLESCQ